MQQQENIRLLFHKYIDQTINAEELSQLYLFFKINENEKTLDQLLHLYFEIEAQPNPQVASQAIEVKNLAWNNIEKRIKQPVVLKFWQYQWFFRTMAAVIVVVAVSVTFFLLNGNFSVSISKSPISAKVKDINPGSNRATLTSSNGKVYNLSGDKGEIIADQNSIRYKDGVVLADEPNNNTVTLSTPRGGQYKAVLSDGTTVWLNAGSSLTYPTNFIGSQRRVELTGEAYFEVAHNSEQPFIVVTKHQQIKVLGTSFNVNAYQDENKTVTTLLAGKVQLNKNSRASSKLLLPGQQAVLGNEDFNIQEVDAEVFAAWKDGQFRFKAASLIDVLKQVERWYDLNIDYNEIPTDVYVHASISKNRKLSTVLDALETITDLKFEINGRSVKIMH